MTRGVRWYLVSSLVLVALVVLAGCSHYLMAEREPWRHEAEASCLNSGAVKDSPGRVQITAIEGPGACGIDYPLKVSELGEPGPLSYDDEAPVPPGSIPNASTQQTSMPQNSMPTWPGAQSPTMQSSAIQSNPLPPVQTTPQSSPYSQSQPYPAPRPNPAPPRYTPAPSYSSAPQYPPAQTYAPPPAYPQQQPYPQSQPYPQQPTGQIGQPLSIDPPGMSPTGDNDDDLNIPGGPPHPYYGGPTAPIYSSRPPNQQPSGPVPPLGPPGAPMVTASAGPVGVEPPATLACPIVSALDQWISGAVQPAALHWFRQPVVQIKQISAYSCRGMNGDPNAHISEHAFGNALDIAEFDLADGHRITVQYGWHGTPEEQGFLHDVQASACDQFTTVLAPGANVYHYNHIHVDLMRHYSSRHICEPSAISGEVAAARARTQFAARHYGDPNVTGSIKARKSEDPGEDDDHLPDAEPGND
jgi:hypothetical protein